MPSPSPSTVSRSRPPRKRPSGRSPTARARRSRISAMRPSPTTGRRQLPGLHGRDRGRARARCLLHPQAGGEYGGAHRVRACPPLAALGDGDAGGRPAGARARPRPGFTPLGLGRAHGGGGQPLPRARLPPARFQPPGHGRQSRCLHPLHPVRARLPRGPGERRHRHGRARRAGAHRVRFRRPHGRQHLRRLWRVRAGLPHGRAHARQPRGRRGRRRSRGGPQGGQRLPLLRRRLPAHLQHPRRPPALRRWAATGRPTTSACA